MEADFDHASSRTRAQRAVGLIAVSLVAIVCTGLVYLHPSLPGFPGAPNPAHAPVLQSVYTVSAVDFVDSATGWVAAQFQSGNVAVLHTTDGGETWTRQLSVSG